MTNVKESKLVMETPERCGRCPLVKDINTFVSEGHCCSYNNQKVNLLDKPKWCPLQNDNSISGYVTKANAVHKMITYVYPIKHDYSDKDHPNYFKYSCPVCEALGNKHQVHKGDTNCPLCNVNLMWEEPEDEL